MGRWKKSEYERKKERKKVITAYRATYKRNLMRCKMLGFFALQQVDQVQ
jgi:hypothetical protein